MPLISELVAELSNVTYDFTKTGKIRVEAKEQMKKRNAGSPDLADALCLTFFNDDTDTWGEEDFGVGQTIAAASNW